MKTPSILFEFKKLGIMGLLCSCLIVFSCKNTGKGIQKDYQNNKEEVGEAVEEAGEELQDDNN